MKQRARLAAPIMLDVGRLVVVLLATYNGNPMPPYDLERLSLLIEQIKELHLLLDEDMAEEMVNYLEGKVNDIRTQRLNLLRHLRDETVKVSQMLSEGVIKSILSAIDAEVEQLTSRPSQRDDLLKGITGAGGFTSRRLPIYIVIDDSRESDESELHHFQQTIDHITTALMCDPQALETAWIATISISSPPSLMTPITELISFQPPIISWHNTPSDIVGAFGILRESIQKDVVMTTETRKGDWKPMVFLLVPGQSENLAENAHLLVENKPLGASIFAIAHGDKPDIDVLKKITESIFQAKDITPDAIGAFFRWMSASVKSFDEPSLPPLPTMITIIP